MGEAEVGSQSAGAINVYFRKNFGAGVRAGKHLHWKWVTEEPRRVRLLGRSETIHALTKALEN
jgi:hypothetical protein